MSVWGFPIPWNYVKWCGLLSFNRYLLSTICGPGVILTARDGAWAGWSSLSSWSLILVMASLTITWALDHTLLTGLCYLPLRFDHFLLCIPYMFLYPSSFLHTSFLVFCPHLFSSHSWNPTVILALGMAQPSHSFPLQFLWLLSFTGISHVSFAHSINMQPLPLLGSSCILL